LRWNHKLFLPGWFHFLKKMRFNAISGFQPSNRPTEATWKTTMKFGYHRTITWL
jgi:hypothetical protein